MFAEQAFRMFDRNGDGRIEFRELAIALGVAGILKIFAKLHTNAARIWSKRVSAKFLCIFF